MLVKETKAGLARSFYDFVVETSKYGLSCMEKLIVICHEIRQNLDLLLQHGFSALLRQNVCLWIY
jgi:hypothetical protein